jgi:hypothetical protein
MADPDDIKVGERVVDHPTIQDQTAFRLRSTTCIGERVLVRRPGAW